jgi:hydroxyacyl-ACP dehydratase HTD2-like protein with hotdog domain
MSDTTTRVASPIPAVGDRLPDLEVTPSALQLFLFSAATQNAHRIHYDWRWATEVERYRGLLVHGPLQEALVARYVADWAGARGRLKRLRTQNRGSAYAGDRLRIGGTVRAVDGATVELELALRADDGTVLLPADADVEVGAAGPAVTAGR